MAKQFTKKGPGRNQGNGDPANLSLKQRLSGQFARDLRSWITALNTERRDIEKAGP